MNRSEVVAKWNALSPRERDTWVAEVVFGNEVIGHSAMPWRRVKAEKWEPVPYFSTEISAAWAVFERFEYAEIARIPDNPPIYGVRINGTDGDIRAMAQAATFPEAICLAALIAKLCPQEYE